MHIVLESWIRSVVSRTLGNERGQSELLILGLLIFLVWLLASSRRLIVQ